MSHPEEVIVAETSAGRNGLALATMLNRSQVSAQYLVQIYTEAAPICYLTVNSTGRRSAYESHPILFKVADLVCDSGANSTFTCTLVADRTVPLRLGDGTYVRFDTLHELIAEYPALAAGALVRVWLEYDDDITLGGRAAMFTGNVRNLAGVTAGTITFVCECVDDFELTVVPSLKIEAAPASLTGATLTAGAKESPVPVNLGGFAGSIAGHHSLVDPDGAWYLRNAGAFGLAVPLAPCVPWYDYTQGSGATAKATTGFITTQGGRKPPASIGRSGFYLDIGGGKLGRFYHDWYNNGSFYAGAESEIIDNTDVHHHVRHGTFPWIQVPISCVPVGTASSLLDEMKRACDGNSNTYGTLKSGTGATFAIQNPGSGFGRISMNSTDAGTDGLDFEGAGVPVGLKVCVLLVNDATGDEPAGGNSFSVRVTFPNGTTAFGASGSFPPPTCADASGSIPVHACQLNIPGANANEPNTPGAGWIGTKFHQWDFTTDAESGKALSQGDGQENPFRIEVFNGESLANVRVCAVVLLVGCHYGREAGSPVIETAPDQARAMWRAAGGSGALPYRIVRPNDAFNSSRSALDLWGRGTTGTPVRGKAPGLTVFTSRPSYWDETDGRYSGTASKMLTDPLEHMLWAMCNSGADPVDIANIITTAGMLGSVADARAILSRWWATNTVDSVGWPMDFSFVDDGRPLRDALNEIGQHCLGLRCVRGVGGNYRFLLWGPMDLIGPTRGAYVSGASGKRVRGLEQTVSIGRQILAGPSGAELEVWPGGYDEVCNDITIRYGPQLQWTATCNKNGSDDGTGKPWGKGGVMPFSRGLTCQEIAAWSDAKYGARNPLRIDLPGVSIPQVAVQVGLYWFGRKYRTPIYWRATGNLGLCDVWPGHILRFDDDLLELAEFRLPLDDSATHLWSDKHFFVDRSENRSDNGISQEVSGFILPTRFALEAITGGEPDQTPWVYPDEPPVEPPPPGSGATVGGPADMWPNPDDDTFPDPRG